MDEPIDPLRAFRLLAHSDLGAEAPTLGCPLPHSGPQANSLLDERFRLEEILAAGGMGQVWRATDLELDRAVALKVSLVDGEQAVARFAREAELTASLRHPNVLQVHGSGSSAGWSYIVYELIEGAQTFADAAALLDLEARLTLFENAVAGVAAAHAAGIVHRDLKPHNVLVRPSGSAVVADFGVAHVASSELTRSGQQLGTPGYMSPEQIRGEPIGPEADVWALGVMLYDVLYDVHPFADDSGLPGVLRRVLNGEVEFPAGPPPALIELLRGRVLAVDPRVRLSDAQVLLEAFREARAGRVERPPTPLWAAVSVALACLAVGAAGWVAWVREDPATPPAAEPPVGELAKPDRPALRPPVQRASWALPKDCGTPQAARWAGERLVIAFPTQLAVFDLRGTRTAHFPQHVTLLGQAGESVWCSNEQGTFRLDAASGVLNPLFEHQALACEPRARRFVALVDGVILALAESGEVLLRCELPEPLTASQAFVSAEHALVVVHGATPRMYRFAWGGGHDDTQVSPGRLAVFLGPDERLALTGESGFVWVYPKGLSGEPVRLERDHAGQASLVSLRVAHLGGVREVILLPEGVLSWGRNADESHLVVWTADGAATAVHSAENLRAVAVSPDGRLARVSAGRVTIEPLSAFLAEDE